MTYFNQNEADRKVASSAALPDNIDQLKGTINFSLVQGRTDNRPESHERTLAEFIAVLLNHQERVGKDGPGFIPAKFKEGTRRASANVEEITALVLDIDDGTPYQTLLPKLRPYAHVYHTSHSHTPEHPKYRVVIFLSQPVVQENWAHFWCSAQQHFGHMDAATKDPARLYYLPAHPPGSSYEARFHDGKLLSPDDLPSLSIDAAVGIRSIRSIKQSQGSTSADIGIEQVNDPKPEKGLQAVVDRCNFLQYASHPNNQGGLSEPQWMAMMTNACGFENSDGWIHAASEHHGDYDELETQQRIERYRQQGYAPTTCESIRLYGFTGCPEGGCKTCKGESVKAPAGLWGWITQTQSSSGTDGNDSTPRKTGRSREATPPEQTLQDKAETLVGELFGGNLAFCQSRTVAYADGYWSAIDHAVHLQRPLLEKLGRHAKVSDVNALIEMMKIMYATDESNFERHSNYICLRNGTLDPANSTLLPHSPSHFLPNRVDIDFDPAALCPLWLQTLNEIFAPDEDREDKIRLLQEFIGYCLVADTSFHKFLWLVGGGGNGKSLVLSILIALIGKKNVSNAQIERLDNAYVRAELQGKLVNISSEMSAQATVTDGYLKQIVSGDVIEAERKYQPSFSFKPYVRLIAATNALPRLLDHSDGFFRRALILRFNRQFLDNERDLNRESKLNAELPGILNWALQGREALYRRGNFILPVTSRLEVEQYRVDSDPVHQFADECLRATDERSLCLSASEIFSRYTEWSRENGYHPLSIVQFSRRLEAIGFKKFRTSDARYWNACFAGGIIDSPPPISSLASNYQV